jgi:hypothetical protein
MVYSSGKGIVGSFFGILLIPQLLTSKEKKKR